MTSPPRRWFRFSLRTMFVLVTMACVWLGWQVKWLKDRERASAEHIEEMLKDENKPLRRRCYNLTRLIEETLPPWQIRLLGGDGVKQFDRVSLEQVGRFRSLFPESEIIDTEGKVYASSHDHP